MQFFAYSLTREELLQDLLTAQYGRLNIYLIYSYSTFHNISPSGGIYIPCTSSCLPLFIFVLFFILLPALLAHRAVDFL